ncbi:hypothetical protein, partial [Nitrosospira sp. NpAV]|uniref:hypothetical protein n=2 Tax=Nitrosomonadaceae TaxID=206379 RepID=UPI0034D2FB7F
HEPDGSKMHEPEPSISHKAQPHPAACQNQRETADDKQYEQKMNDKYDIGHLLNTFAKLPIQKQQYNKRILLGYFWIFVPAGIVIALICRIPSVSGSSSALYQNELNVLTGHPLPERQVASPCQDFYSAFNQNQIFLRLFSSISASPSDLCIINFRKKGVYFSCTRLVLVKRCLR